MFQFCNIIFLTLYTLQHGCLGYFLILPIINNAMMYIWVHAAAAAAAAAAVKSLQSCPTLWDSIDGSPPGSSVPGILQARTLEWAATFLLQCMKVKSDSEVVQLCLTPHDPMDCSLPGSSTHGIFQAKVLEWAAISFGSSQPRDRTRVSGIVSRHFTVWAIREVPMIGL